MRYIIYVPISVGYPFLFLLLFLFHYSMKLVNKGIKLSLESFYDWSSSFISLGRAVVTKTHITCLLMTNMLVRTRIKGQKSGCQAKVNWPERHHSSPGKQTTIARFWVAWPSLSYRRSLAISVPWQGKSAMQMRIMGLACWQTPRLKQMRVKKSSSVSGSRPSLKKMIVQWKTIQSK